MTDEKLREMAREWLQKEFGSQFDRFPIRRSESLAALLQRVRDETRAERGHSIGVGNWVHRDDGYWVIRTGVPRG